MFKRKAFKRFVALVTVLLLMLSTVSVGFAATGAAAATDPTVVYATKDGKTLMFTFADIVNAYALGDTAYQALWEGATKVSVTVNGKNVSFPDFVTAFGTGAATDLAGFAATAPEAKAPANVSPVAANGAVGVDQLNAASVNAIDDLTVVYGTALEDAGLPAEVDVTLVNGDAVKSPVEWDEGTPAYDGNKPGTYVFEGTVTGTDLKAALNVIVSDDQAAPVVVDKLVADYKTLKVVFNEPVKGTPVVKLDWVAVEAKYVALSEDGMSLTVTSPAGEYATKTNYDILLNGLTDLAGNPMEQNTAVSIDKPAPYAAQFVINTIGGEALSAVKVETSVLDQYGKSYNYLTDATSGHVVTTAVTASIGSYPLSVTDNHDGSFVIAADNAMVEGSVVNFTITGTLNGTVTTTASKSLGITDQAPKPSVITSLGFNSAIETTPGSGKVLSAVVYDQYGNVVVNPAIRWTTSNNGFVAFTGSLNTTFVDTTTGNVDLTFVSAGTATVTAVLQSNISVAAQKTVTVTATPAPTLAAIDAPVFAQVNKYNRETLTSNPLTFTNGAVLTPGMLSFEVKSKPASASNSDITLVASYDANGKIVISATTSVAGDYLFDAYTYVGDTKVVTPDVPLTTVLNPNVTSMSVDTIPVNKLTAGGEYKSAITFKNAHGEVIPMKANLLSILSTGNMTVQKYAKDADGKALATPIASADEATTDVSYLGFSGAAAGSDTVTLVTGGLVLQVYTTTVPASVITSFKLGATNVSVIKNDNLDEVTPASDDSTVMVGGTTEKPVSINFFDQYGNDIAASGITVEYAGTDHTTQPVMDMLSGLANDLVLANSTGVKYLGFKATDTTASQYVTVKVTRNADNVVLGTARVFANVQDARKAKSFTLNSFATSVMEGANFTITQDKVYDQYGREFPLTASYRYVVDENADNTTLSVTGMDVTVAKSGSEAITVKLVYNDGANDTVVDSKTYNMIVNSIDDIGSISLSPVSTLNVKADAATVVTPYNTAAVGYVVRNANGIAIDVPATKVAWSSSDPSVATIDVNGVVTALKAGTTVIKGVTQNAKEATTVVTVVDAAFTLSSIKFVDAPTTVKLGATADLGAKLKYYNGSVELVKAFALTGYTLEFTSTNPSIATVNLGTGVVTPNASNVLGTTTIVVKVMNGTTFTGIYTSMSVTVIAAE